MEIDYDPVKSASNQRKHGFSLADAMRFEWETAQIEEDTRYAYGEQRFKATGLIEHHVCVAIYCERGGVTRMISLRKADKHEAKHYAHYYATTIETPYPYPGR